MKMLSVPVRREFPPSWMKRHIESSGMKVLTTKSFTILHSQDSAIRQIRVAQSKLLLMKDNALRRGMEIYLQDLEIRAKEEIAKNNGRIPLSFDYIIEAQMTDNNTNQAKDGNDTLQASTVENNYNSVETTQPSSTA